MKESSSELISRPQSAPTGDAALGLRRQHVLSPVTALAFYNAGRDGDGDHGGGENEDSGADDADRPRRVKGTSTTYLLAGDDTDLVIYDAGAAGEGEGERRLRGRLPNVFREQAIHGIAVAPAQRGEEKSRKASSRRNMLVWGGHSVAVLSGDLIERAVASAESDDDLASASLEAAAAAETTGKMGQWYVPREATAPDWILDGAISPFRDDEASDDRIVLLTAHNEVIEARVTGDDEFRGAASITFGPVRSPSRPILYSGNLCWDAADCVLVAAGTVFGEILVWRCGLGTTATAAGEQQGGGDCEVLFVFSGHEGSIFGVHISPEIEVRTTTTIPSGDATAATTTTTRLLASCSDDRTVRVWDITEDPRSVSTRRNRYGHGDAQARQTGFGDSMNVSSNDDRDAGRDGDGDDSSGRCLAVAMGHLSRIWRVEFAPWKRTRVVTSDALEIYSFGEDATAQKWHLNLGGARGMLRRQSTGGSPGAWSKATLTHQATYANHSGKQIWSQAIRASGKGFAVATGGADGKIALVEDDILFDDANGTRSETGQCRDSADSGRMVSFALSDLSKACIRQHTGDVGAKEPTDGSAPAQTQNRAKNAREGFQRYAFIREDRLLVITSFGRLFLGTFDSSVGGGLQWTQIPLPEETSRAIFSYSVLRSSRSGPLAFVGTTSGELFYYDDDDVDDRGAMVKGARASLRPLARVHGKVADIFCLSDDGDLAVSGNSEPSAQPRAEILVTVLGSTKAVVMRLGDLGASPDEVEVTLEPGFSVTAAAFFRGYLVLGSRNGSICVLGRDRGGYSARSTLRVKLDDAITSIVPLPQTQGQDHQQEEEDDEAGSRSSSTGYCFLATCRDGKYRIYELHTTIATACNAPTASKSVTLQLLHEVALRSGSVIEGGWFSDDEVLLCGFRGKNMVLWNETRRREVASVECGGGHRSFTYTPVLGVSRPSRPGSRGGSEGFRFVFTKAARMHVFSQAGAAQRTLKPGGHGREIKAASASPSGRYLATGAEDTTIRIWERQVPDGDADEQQQHSKNYITNSNNPGRDGRRTAARDNAPDFRCVAVLEKHATGIQTLRWHGDEHLFSSGGSEEFFVWRVRRIPGCGACPVGVVCEAAFPDRSEAGDLRIVAFDVERGVALSPHADGGTGLDLEIAETETEEPTFRISMALSNSTLQTYTYTRGQGFRLQGRQGYTGACLTQLRHLVGSGGAVLTAATDGHLAVFGDVPLSTTPRTQQQVSLLPTGGQQHHGAAKPTAAAALALDEEAGLVDVAVDPRTVAHVSRIHQNSVKSLDVRSVSLSGGGGGGGGGVAAHLVVTGGDDNAMGITCLQSDAAWTTSTSGDSRTRARVEVRNKAIVRSAHAAAVTGIVILRLLEGGRDAIVVTASTDQRVKAWRLIGWQSPGPRVVLLDDRYSAIADSGDLETLDDRRVLVAGVGMEIWSVLPYGRDSV